MSALRLIFRKVASINSVRSCNFCSSSSVSLTKRLGIVGTAGGRLQHVTPDCYPRPVILSPSLVPSSVIHQPYRNAGHSKWSNIKHVKQEKDMARSAQITKYLNYVKAAIRESGNADPKTNSKLAATIQQVKDAKLPMAAVDRLILSYQNKKDSQACIYPVRGPGNCTMLIDLESPNVSKSKQEVNTILRKNKGIIADNSMVNLFEQKGLLLASEIDGKPITEEFLDEATMHAIEAGANDVTFIGDHPEFGAVLEFSTEPSAFFKVKGALEGMKYNLAHADLLYIPNICVELNDEEIEAANKLFTKLTEHSDVQNVFVNIA